MTTILEISEVSPPPGGPTELFVPLTLFDIMWVHFHRIQRLLFYDHPSSQPYFSENLIPNLKRSLSLALQHYLPLSGHLIYPLNTAHDDDKKPVFRYRVGDSVSFTTALSEHDFDELVADNAQDADRFYEFVPEMPPPKDELDCKVVPVLALKATLFPGRGVCIGFSNHHSIGDACSIFAFLKAWSSIAKSKGVDFSFSFSTFDRCFVEDPSGVGNIYWKSMREIALKPRSFPLPTNRVRATFTLDRANIERLKDLVSAEKPSLGRVSSFVVTVSYVRACLAKSSDEIGEETDDDVVDYLIFAVDLRARMDPPVPDNYFGNCLGFGLAKIEHRQLVGGKGFMILAEAVAKDIKNRLNNKHEVLRGAENWISNIRELKGSKSTRVVGVSGSPKFDFSDVDFGWGKARKLEVVSIDGDHYSISLSKSRGSNGGLEVGLSLPRDRMEAFGAIFAKGLMGS
ncbi:HXXXD-type acyl-transferase family protein [Striga asiatica]|uniref:HXXXD-type acyl-transferase family protein n=1 Tax=Striga asiatica TaxID=4170 RepID=A0A5A7QD08_STRAF|nr:HXXXD-type acyl-transferase family protein [Striga asiatica]